jgi:soluble lytic murein transglycosylase-like protein
LAEASANLYDIDKGLEAGTAILASQRKAVRGWLDACKAPVAFDIGTYTRLAYANPSLTKAMLAKARSRSETVHPFRDAETYVEHWRAALRVVRAQGAVS